MTFMTCQNAIAKSKSNRVNLESKIMILDVEFVSLQQLAILNYFASQDHLSQRFVHSRELRAGDLVLRRILNRAGLHKLSPSWEGPFKVTEVCRPGCVRLATEEGVPLPNPWNIEHLRKFYT